MRARAADTSARAEREGLVLHGFSRRVADGLVRGQDRRRAEHRIRTAHLPRERSLREFDPRYRRTLLRPLGRVQRQVRRIRSKRR